MQALGASLHRLSPEPRVPGTGTRYMCAWVGGQAAGDELARLTDEVRIRPELAWPGLPRVDHSD
jgi:hypothetical protein